MFKTVEAFRLVTDTELPVTDDTDIVRPGPAPELRFSMPSAHMILKKQ